MICLRNGFNQYLIISLMFNIILEQAPLEKIGFLMGIGTLLTAIAPALGPTYGGGEGNRTPDTGIFSPLLYQLSYPADTLATSSLSRIPENLPASTNFRNRRKIFAIVRRASRTPTGVTQEV